MNHRAPRWRRRLAKQTSATKVVLLNSAETGRGPWEFHSRSVTAGVVVCLQDPRCRTAGMLHFTLPQALVDPSWAGEAPYTFADSGIAELIVALESRGAQRRRLEARIVGGASAPGSFGPLSLGSSNTAAVHRIFDAMHIPILGQAIGGSALREVLFRPAVNNALVSVSGQPDELI